MLDSPKLAIRFDDQDHGATTGQHGKISKNIAWNTGGFELKGDFNNITGNLALENYEKDTPNLIIIHMYYSHTEIQNANSTVEKNVACLADGGVDQHSTPKAPWGRWPVAGIKSNNYYGNHSWHGGDGYDGSWILNGTTVSPPDDLSSLFMDSKLFLFLLLTQVCDDGPLCSMAYDV